MSGFQLVLAELKTKENIEITRAEWFESKGRPRIKLQRPDKDSKMTEEYLYMEKFIDGHFKRFPVTLSSESLLADDWCVVVISKLGKEYLYEAVTGVQRNISPF